MRPTGFLPDPVCERCGTQLTTASRFQAISATGQCLAFGRDEYATAALFPMGGTVACSWGCLAVLAAQRATAAGDADAAVQMVAERERQITQEGFSPERDAGMPAGDFALAAICYAAEHVQNRVEPEWRDLWPWDSEWWKPKSRQRDLVRAGALLAAELDRDPTRRTSPAAEAF